MDELRHFTGESSMGYSCSRIFFVLFFECRDFLLVEKSKVFQIANDVTIIDIDEVLVEAIHAGASRI